MKDSEDENGRTGTAFAVGTVIRDRIMKGQMNYNTRGYGLELVGTRLIFGISDAGNIGGYSFFYSDGERLLPFYRMLSRINADKTGVDYTVFDYKGYTLPPFEAESIVGEDEDGNRVCEFVIPGRLRRDHGEKKALCSAIADIHIFHNDYYEGRLDRINGDLDMQRAADFLNNAGVEYNLIAGDLIISFTDDRNAICHELEKSVSVIKRLDAPFYVMKGNHDKKADEDVWQRLVGLPVDFSFVRHEDGYIFMSLRTADNVDSVDDSPYGEEKLSWLEKQFAEFGDRRIFLFIHYPFYDMAGVTPGGRYGFSENSSEEKRILDMIGKHGRVLVFSGHTHYNFDCCDVFENMCVCRFEGTGSYAVHIPSLAYPRDKTGYQRCEDSEGYLLGIYENGVMLKGIDFVAGEYLPKATWYLDTR